MRHRTMITNTRIVRLCTTRVATPLGSFVFRRCRDTWRVPLQSGRNLYLKRTKNRSRPADADAHPGKSEGHHGHGHGHEHGHDAHGHDDGQNHHHDHHPHQRDEHGHACGHDSQLESVLSGGHHDGHACGAHHMHGGHGHGFSDLIVPLTVLGGFLLFFLSERLVRAIVGEAGGSHNHHHGSSQRTEEKDEVARRKKNDDIADTEPTGAGERKPLKASGVLNLAADALHNLSDGIAIGAAFASGGALGRSTALATLFHELPHEIGDFAVLIESGMSKWQAISAQFCTAAAAFAGTALGLLATSFSGVETYLLAATAGGFVYVSCVAVMPDILNSSPSFPQAIAEVLAMCTGIALMAGVAILE